MKRSIASILVAAGLLGTTSSIAMAADWPERPVQLVVVAGAGGGSDYTFRLLAAELEAALGQPFPVVNQAQASGIVGYTTYTAAAPDGYVLGQLSPIAQFTLLGQANFTPENFTAIAQFNADPSAIHVSASSDYQDLASLVAAIKEDPGSLNISCGGTCNASWDIPFVAMLLGEGVDVTKLNLIPAQGSSAALQELASGGIDVVLCSIPEATALKDAGVVKTLAVMSEKRLPIDDAVPTVEEAIGTSYVGGTWRGIAGPAGMEPALVERIEGAVENAVQQDRFIKGMEDRGFGIAYLDHAAFTQFLTEHFDETRKVLDALSGR
ncbi:Tripartite-type tricarboxylate transporter, receptor component TctC [Aureimonas altamirensis DSM 21988]|uniref:Tripartite-type tricarboxylate transporter, receptor component TctC n=1 Tax=Aureimonas altamirensis DSM 21988 TaxID=1121026 RepID=A0ABY1IQM9_9HYPH|nr:tripartite tricarboxylate transporter substrate binding protein [Aureimonas altamirensis]SHJ93025.1 Tripartite-type tricarboxylate transporter, receptor component TctC [Aureimonas altamirensis DSM 21988]